MAVSWIMIAAFALVVFESSGWSEPSAERRVLPPPATSGGPALATVLATRRSQRAFARRGVAEPELGQLMWAAQGAVDGHRTAPSAGALYPLVVRVVDASGVWRYVPGEHTLVRESADDRRGKVVAASFGQECVRSAPEVFVISAEVAVTARKYGRRAERFATLEAGHAAQNLLLEATALGLAGVPVGAFDDDALRRALDLTSAETPLYVIPIGSPATKGSP